jgi:DNA-binding transcriptional LysR family regulator
MAITCPFSLHMKDLVETAELAAFVRTVAARSLSRAARELGAPRTTIARRLGRLEERLGVRLLRRTTRSLTLTDAGEVLYGHARSLLEAVKNAEASVREQSDVIRGDVRVSVLPLRHASFHSMLAAFATRFPEVRLFADLSAAPVDLHRDGYDIALRAGPNLDFEPGLVAQTLFRSRTLAVASPRYLARHGTPEHTRDLLQHRCLMGFARSDGPQTHWPTRNGRKIAVAGCFFSNDLTLRRDAACAGLGIALLPRILAERELTSGELVAVLEDSIGSDERLAIVYPERELVPPQVRALIDAIVAWARANLGPVLDDRPEVAAGSPRRSSRRARRSRTR